MSPNLENQIQTLLIEKCCFCHKEVSPANLAGFSHQKDFIFFLKKPICQNCWEKETVIKSNSQNYSSLKQIKNTNQRLQDRIKSWKEKQKNKPKNPLKEEKIYGDW